MATTKNVGYWLDNRDQSTAAIEQIRDCIKATPPTTKWVAQVSSQQTESLHKYLVDGYDDIYPCIETQGMLGNTLDNPDGWEAIGEIQRQLFGEGFADLWLDHESLMSRSRFWQLPTSEEFIKRVLEQSSCLTRRTKWYIAGWFDNNYPVSQMNSEILRRLLGPAYVMVGLRFAYCHEANKTFSSNKYWPSIFPITDKHQLIYINTSYNRWSTAWMLDNVSSNSFMKAVRRCWNMGQIPIIYPGNAHGPETLTTIQRIQKFIDIG